MIGDEIEVSVLAIMGEKVRIGIQAPRAVPVFRTEVYVTIDGDQLSSNGEAPEPAEQAPNGSAPCVAEPSSSDAAV